MLIKLINARYGVFSREVNESLLEQKIEKCSLV